MFSLDRLSRISELERWHFWFAGRRALVNKLLKRYLLHKTSLILDLGCGSGSMVHSLTRQGYRVVGLDYHLHGLHAVSQLLPQPWLMRGEATHVPLRDSTFDAILMLDVLEHVKDQKALAEVHRILRPGGLAIVTVPAIPWLWSYRDEAAGHLRRYTRRQAKRVLVDADFGVIEDQYYQFNLLPVLLICRLFGRRGPGLRDMEERPSPMINAVLTWVNKLEVGLSDIIRWPLGSSLAIVCRKGET